MTVDDILERQRMATQVSNDDEKEKTPVQTGNGGAATSGVTPAATPANETQKGISQADARVNYSTREPVPAQQNIVPQGKSQEYARVNYTTPVWERDDSNDSSSTYNVAKAVAPTSKTDNDGDSYSSSIRRAEANRQSQMARLVDYLNKQYPEDNETPEERKKRIRRERVAAVMSALGDGISAISNIYFTTRGANSTFNAKDGLVPKWQELYDKRVKERNDKAKERMEALMQMYNLSKDDLNSSIAIDNNETNKIIKREDQDRKNKLAQIQELRAEAASTKDEAAAFLATTRANLMQEGFSNEQALKIAKKKLIDEQTEAAKAKADKDRRQGTSAWVSPSKGRGGSSGGNSEGYTEIVTTDYIDKYDRPRQRKVTKQRIPNKKGNKAAGSATLKFLNSLKNKK